MAIGRSTLIPAALVVALAGAAVAGYLYWEDQRERERQLAEERREEAERARFAERAEQWHERLRAESGRLMPEVLGDVVLGMDVEALRAERPRARLERERTDPQKFFWEEQLGNGAQVMYGFDKVSSRLLHVQILSRMPTPEAIAPHLTAMNETYGTPTGVWDCPDTEGVPTRRFTWRGDVTSMADIFLLHESGISVTLYIAPTEVIHRSLMMSGCRPLESADQLEVFPVATREQLRQQTPQTQ